MDGLMGDSVEKTVKINSQVWEEDDCGLQEMVAGVDVRSWDGKGRGAACPHPGRKVKRGKKKGGSMKLVLILQIWACSFYCVNHP
jgi:hypothetical protein